MRRENGQELGPLTPISGPKVLNAALTDSNAPHLSDEEKNAIQFAELVLRVFLSESLNANTLRARKSDLTALCVFQKRKPIPCVVSLAQSTAGELRVLVADWMAAQRNDKLSDATVNRRLISLRVLLTTCKMIGADHLPDPLRLIRGVKVKSYRDTRGPGTDAVARLLDGIDRQTLHGKRNYALICCLYFSALRRGEAVGLQREDVDFVRRRIRIRGKGRGTQYEWISIAPVTADALGEWMIARDDWLKHDNPLWKPDKKDSVFICFSRSLPPGTRLIGRGVHKVVSRLGWEIVGEHIRPHGLRHTAITEALEQSGGDVILVQDYSRHVKMETVKHYDDRRRDDASLVTNMVADAMKKRRRQ